MAVLKGFTEVQDGEEVERVFTLADVDMLEQALLQTRAKLIIIDPLQGFLGGGVDMHRANEVRPVLAGLGRLAEKYGCAVVAIRHLSKSNKTGALHRGLGSVDFTAFARSQLLVGKHNEQRVITHSKSSLAPEGESLVYDIRDGALVWLGGSDATPDDVASNFPVKQEDGEADKLEQAQALITLALDETPTPATQLYQEAAQNFGISKRTMERAKTEMHLKSTPLRLPKAPSKKRLALALRTPDGERHRRRYARGQRGSTDLAGSASIPTG